MTKEINWDRAQYAIQNRIGGVGLDKFIETSNKTRAASVDMLGAVSVDIPVTPGNTAVANQLAGKEAWDIVGSLFAALPPGSPARDAITKLSGDIPAVLSTGRIGRASFAKKSRAILKDSEFSESHKDSLEKTITKFSELSSQYRKTEGSSHTLTISFDPWDICRCGLFHVDSNACFLPGGHGGLSPVAFSQTAGGCIMMLKDNTKPWKVVARGLGLVSPQYIYASNFYPNTDGGLSRKLMVEAVTALAATHGMTHTTPFKPTVTRRQPLYGGLTTSNNSGRVYTNSDGVLFSNPSGGKQTPSLNAAGLGINLRGPHYISPFHSTEAQYVPYLHGITHAVPDSRFIAYRGLCAMVSKEYVESLVPALRDEYLLAPNKRKFIPKILLDAVGYAMVEDGEGAGTAVLDIKVKLNQNGKVVLKYQ